MISLDSETTGIDLYHGAKPFLVTTCDEDGNQRWWQWDVDPLTREPEIPEGDIEEIRQLIADADEIVLQNAKFDVAALAAIGITDWPWYKTHDTLLAGHLLASNQPHDLTSMALHYLGVDIEPYEDRLEEATKKARSIIQHAKEDDPLSKWLIAAKDRPGMPSASAKVWKYDSWLPRALVHHLAKSAQADDCQSWWTVLEDYANADSAITIHLWQAMKRHLTREPHRGLWTIYEERRKLLPIVYDIERQGVTVNKTRLESLKKEYSEESKRLHNRCIEIAKKAGHDIVLPKTGANNSLREFCFDVLGLELVKYGKKGNTPSLDKSVLDYYENTLPEGSEAKEFFGCLRRKRKRDTAISYLQGYERFALSTSNRETLLLHPSLNPCGTDTLRFSSSNPNSQNASKEDIDGHSLRYCFGPAEDREWWSIDAKNIELRIPAYESGEEDFIALFERPDDPPYYGSNHLLIFHVLHPELWDAAAKEVGPDKAGPYCKKKYAASWYQWTKNGNFAVQYGAVDKDDGTGTADRAYHKPGAQALIKARFKKQEHLNQHWIRFADKYGYVETIPDRSLGVRHGYPIFCTRTEYGKVKPTVPLSYHVQGTAMWWTIKAMIRCHNQLEEWNKKAGNKLYWMVLQVHDELVFSFPRKAHPLKDPKRSNLGRIRILQRLMEMGGEDIGVPTPVGIEYHDNNWGEGVTIQ